jgi:hypothetical protein
MIVNAPHVSRTVATSAARRGPVDRRRVAAAHATSATGIAGMARMIGSMLPIIPPRIDSCTM